MTEVELEVEAGVATITLNAPQRRNALTTQMADELVVACDRIDGDPAVGAVVLQGRGDSFCAGADRAALASAGEDPAGQEAFDAISRIYRAFTRVGELGAPSIAAVRGHAVGAGLNLALAADLRVAGYGARFASGFLRIGLHPGGGHFALLARAVGPGPAAAIGLFGQEIDGQRAAALGLASECVPDAEVEARAREMAAVVAGDPELSRAAVRSMRTEIGPPALPWAASLAIERGPQMRSFRRRGGGR